MSKGLTNYTPDDIDRLKKEAVTNIASENLADIKIGSEALTELIGICGALQISKEITIQLIESVHDDVSELKNPWFADQRMKEAMMYMKQKNSGIFLFN